MKDEPKKARAPPLSWFKEPLLRFIIVHWLAFPDVVVLACGWLLAV